MGEPTRDGSGGTHRSHQAAVATPTARITRAVCPVRQECLERLCRECRPHGIEDLDVPASGPTKTCTLRYEGWALQASQPGRRNTPASMPSTRRMRRHWRRSDVMTAVIVLAPHSGGSWPRPDWNQRTMASIIQPTGRAELESPVGRGSTPLNSEESTMHLKGSCHCGKVKFTVESAEPVPFMRCYCSICRKTAGAGGYAINLGAVARSMKVTGKRHLRIYRARLANEGSTGTHLSTARRYFCAAAAARCGCGIRRGLNSCTRTPAPSTRRSRFHRRTCTAWSARRRPG